MRAVRAVVFSAALGLAASPAGAQVFRPGAFIRVDQVGYVAPAGKRAFYMARGSTRKARFEVRDAGNAVVLSAPLGAPLGPWSRSFPRLYAFDFSAVTTPGTYTIAVTGRTPAVSPAFRIDTAANLYTPLLPNAVAFYRAQRDGPNVDPTILGRQPSHLADQAATAYAAPTYVDGVLVGSLTAVGGPLDASGGWFDAGDYVKFVETTSYTVTALLLAVRDHAGLFTGPADLASEARFGLDWLLKMWDDTSRTLHYQVGLGDGNGGTILGDHDFWRPPEADDALVVAPGDPAYYVKNRPVFRVGPAGALLSPNLAGRVGAALALGSQVYRATDAAYADRCLTSAEHAYDLARTTGVGTLLTTSPHDFYPEVEWRDDMELGGAELYFAVAGAASLPPGLPHTDPAYYLGVGAQWARAYRASPTSGYDALSVYDVGGLAHYELHRAITAAGDPSGLAVTKADLVADLRRILALGLEAANQDRFGLGGGYFPGGAAPQALGYALLASFHQELTGAATYDAFGLRQLDWVLGGNPWGVSFLVGAGATFTTCLHHQIANLAGSLDGTPPVLLGAVVNGPVDPADLAGLEVPDGALACPPAGVDRARAFNTRSAGFRDSVEAYPSVEPALDYAALTPLLLARQIAAPMGIAVPRWTPPPLTPWQWQLSGLPVDQSLDVPMYDIDAFENDATVVAALHAAGRHVVCYVSAGSWEEFRPDAGSFPASVLGKPLEGWPGERWLDVRRLEVLAPIMEARLDLCRAKGFDAVEADNVDGYANDSGFPLSAADQLRYNRFLADAAHARGLSIGLKNDLDQITDLLPSFDWALNEECFFYDECEKLLPFVAAGKAVFNVEYDLTTAQFCPKAALYGFNSMRKNLDLDASREACP